MPEELLIQSPPPVTLRSLVQPAVDTLKRLWKPFVVIQLCGLALVIAYFKWPAMTRACSHLLEAKRTWGYIFSGVLTPIAAGIIPEIFRTMVLRQWKFDRSRISRIAYTIPLMAVSGIAGDANYRFMAHIYGDDGSFYWAVIKTITDMLIYSPFIGLGIHAIGWEFYHTDFSPTQTAKNLGVDFYLRKVAPLILPCWCFWGPMCLLNYSLPMLLQYSFVTIANCAWGLIIVAMASGEHEKIEQ